MITFKKKPYKAEEVKRILNPLVSKWFFSKFKDFSLPQLHGVMEIHKRKNILVSAPTGATKTLTGFLSVLNELVDSAEKNVLENKIYCVYVSPLRALSEDIRFNLVEPLKEMNKLADRDLGIRIGVRTGDTTQKEKTAMLKNPPHILITTPESLAILLTTQKFYENLKDVQWLIVDEIHALAENKRGVHLSLSVERLQKLSPAMTRVGLSATISPLEEIAKFLVGYEDTKLRNCEIVDVQFIKELDMKVISPVNDLIRTGYEELQDKMYTLINDLVQKHKTTLIFTNTRAGTERVVDRLKNKFPKNYTSNNIGAHHGSLSKDSRFDVEQRLREGKIKCVVSSTSLELGIDIGNVDLVLLLGSPKSVARALQRVGRSGHQLHSITKGRIIVLGRDDLVECSVLLKNAVEKKIDTIHIPTNCLDVLAQQVAAMCIQEKMTVKELYQMVSGSYCYHKMNYSDFLQILDYLSGKFVDLEARHVYAKIWYDEETQMVGRRGKMARVIFMTNVGTIPDSTGIRVKIGDRIIGTIDEAFLERLRPGDVFVLGGNTYQFKFTRGMVAQVSVSVGRPPTVPSWFSEMLPLSFDLAMDISRFRRLMLGKFCANNSKKEIISFINDYLYVDKNAANSIYVYFREQFDFTNGAMPSDKRIIIENYIDEKDNRYIVFHTLFGRRVNDCLSRAVAFAISRVSHKDVEIGINDNGFYVRCGKTVNVKRIIKMLKSTEFEKVLANAIDKTEVLKRRFRHCAGRALMILRNYKGRKKSVGRQQVGSMLLMSALNRIDHNFSILKEARREVLEDLMDIGNAKLILEGIESAKIKVEEITTKIPSPFAFNLILMGYTDILKMDDKHAFLKRMHDLVLAKISVDYGKKGKKEEFNYHNLWDAVEKQQEEDRDEEQEELKVLAWNLERVPIRAKEELVKIIEGKREDIWLEFLKGVEEHKVDIKEKWPKKLSKFLFKVLKELKQ
jgi:ATP-dependent helicase Lhr and Lhr-like helicase